MGAVRKWQTRMDQEPRSDTEPGPTCPLDSSLGRVVGVDRWVCLDVGEPKGGGAETQGCSLNSWSPFFITRPGPTKPPLQP